MRRQSFVCLFPSRFFFPAGQVNAVEHSHRKLFLSKGTRWLNDPIPLSPASTDTHITVGYHQGVFDMGAHPVAEQIWLVCHLVPTKLTY